MFTGDYPYGEIEPFQRPRFGAPVPLQQRRPDLPAWLDQVLGKAVAADPGNRQGDVTELAPELGAGAARPGRGPAGRRPPSAPATPRGWRRVARMLTAAL